MKHEEKENHSTIRLLKTSEPLKYPMMKGKQA